MQRDTSENSNQPKTNVEVITHDYPIDAFYFNNFKNVIYAEGAFVNSEAEIEYHSDSSGLTTRKITIHAYLERTTEVYILAFCHTRNKLRTFKGSLVVHLRVEEGLGYQSLRSWLRELPVLHDQEIIKARAKQLEADRAEFIKLYTRKDALHIIHIFLREHQNLLKFKGWVIRVESDTLTFWRTRLNGTMLKHAHSRLAFYEYIESSNLDIDAETVVTNRYPNPRPWAVRTKESGETFFENHEVALNHLMIYSIQPRWRGTDA